MPWNDDRCDICGKFIAARDFDHGATKKLLTDDCCFTESEIETICIKCNKETKDD